MQAQIPAARYLRSPTYDRNFIELQKKVIQRYATRNGFVVRRSFADCGMRGLRIKNRPAFSALLKYIGRNEIKAVLVYDITRWGRLHYPDDVVRYELLFNTFKIGVHYCAKSSGKNQTPRLAMVNRFGMRA
jgi:DNA invertase Pin-like site-specific DNA recombinase